jgi:hypothetical protein
VREICARAGVHDPDVSELYGLVRGYCVADAGSARQALEPLMLAYGFDVHERDGRLVFRSRTGRVTRQVSADMLARHRDQDIDLDRTRSARADIADRVRLAYVAADGVFDVKAIETALPGADSDVAAQSELNLVLTAAEARAITERWLAEAGAARDTARFALPPSCLDLGAGDVVDLNIGADRASYRIDRCESQSLQVIEAVRVETGIYLSGKPIEEIAPIRATSAPVPPSPIFMDLPLLRSDAVPHAPWIAVAARPWLGDVAVFSSGSNVDFRLNTVVSRAAVVGVTRSSMVWAQPGLPDRGAPLRGELSDGALSSVTRDMLLAGANAMAIGAGGSATWEVFQFERAELVGPDLYDLSLRLRGQLGTEANMPAIWPEGSLVVLLDGALQQVDLPSDARGLSRFFRVGPASQPMTAPSFVPSEQVFAGNGLRPFAPVHLRRRAASDGSHLLSWVRRTRIDGDLWSLTDAPLGEAFERYVVQIHTSAGLRREVIVDAPNWVYPAALREGDSATGGYEVRVAQISDRYGAGSFGKVTLHG